jgi:hypothetical protein
VIDFHLTLKFDELCVVVVVALAGFLAD